MSTNLSTPTKESIVVEAPTVEAALEAVVQQLGTGCRILGAEKVSRGGIAGFFGKETFQVEVALPDLPTSFDAVPTEAPTSGLTQTVHDAQAAVDRVLEAAGLATEQGSDADPGTHATFGDLLRSRVGSPPDEQPSRGPSAEPVEIIDLTIHDKPAGSDPIEDDALGRLREAIAVGRRRDEMTGGESVVPDLTPAPREAETDHGAMMLSEGEQRTASTSDSGGAFHQGAPLFTADHLVRMGLPFSFVSSLGDLQGLSDTERLTALAQALEPWCRTSSDSEHDLIVGTAVGRLGDLLRLPIYGADMLPDGPGGAGWMADPNEPTTLTSLEQARGDRMLHVIDPSPQLLAGLAPGSTISWTDERIGFEALLFALERGLRLGFDLTGRAVRRASALDVAIAIRARLPVARS